MSLGGAFISYGVKFILFSIVAGITVDSGIWSGIKIRKAKNAKSTTENR